MIGLAGYAARGFPLTGHHWKQVSLPRTRSHAHVPGSISLLQSTYTL